MTTQVAKNKFCGAEVALVVSHVLKESAPDGSTITLAAAAATRMLAIGPLSSQHIVHSAQTRLSSKLDGLPQSEMYEDELGNVDVNLGMVPEILLP